ncbi:hypothetical protein WOLCODRAFT_159011 [Wolfiporia cocos MD-104 SS10]|uniref:C2H2-type domain-containing protein n=1 Tax=Wolfiporia cocos (strain MD-104) TaxID=742152 RepID=A0A2H3JB18_WOLCO|nr:hypothetical protein WOLCODRAFT_159011 [Wolfiporia cocos MD-104 SS10]
MMCEVECGLVIAQPAYTLAHALRTHAPTHPRTHAPTHHSPLSLGLRSSGSGGANDHLRPLTSTRTQAQPQPHIVDDPVRAARHPIARWAVVSDSVEFPAARALGSVPWLLAWLLRLRLLSFIFTMHHSHWAVASPVLD